MKARHCEREAIRTGRAALRKTKEGSLEAIVATEGRNGWNDGCEFEELS